MSRPGTSGPSPRATRLSWRRSEVRASAEPGYCTLTATSRPSTQVPSVHLPDRRCRGGLGVEPDEVVLPVRAELAGEDLAHGHGGHRRCRVLEAGQVLAVRRRDLVGQGRLEDRHRLAELHRPALEVTQGAEQLLGGALLHLGQHRLGRGTPDALAEAQRGAAGVPEGQRGQLGGARDGLARQLAHRTPLRGARARRRHTPIVPDEGRARTNNIHTRGAWTSPAPACARARRPGTGSATTWTAGVPRGGRRRRGRPRRPPAVASTGSATSGTPSARAREVART